MNSGHRFFKVDIILYVVLNLVLSSCAAFSLRNQDDTALPGGALLTPTVQGDRDIRNPIISGDISCSYYVSPNGEDGAAGSRSQPWHSFQFAADSSRPGDTVCFLEGIYVVDNTVHISQFGNTENWITFIAYPGDQPILDGMSDVDDLFVINQGVSHLRVSGFLFRNFNSWGLSLEGENRGVYLDHLVVEGGEAGIHFTYGDDDLAPPEGGPVEYITLEDSLIINSEYTAVDCTPGPCNNMTIRRIEIFGSGQRGDSSFGADGIAISRGFPVLIEDCFIHDNGGDGIDLNSRDWAGFASDVVVRRNQVARNHQNGIKLWAGGHIENNIVWGQGNSALWLGTFHSNLEVINNTIAFNMWDPAFSGRNWAFSAGYPEDVVVLPKVELTLVNNIFAFNTGPDLGDPTGLYLGPGVKITEKNNLYFSYADEEITAEFLNAGFSRQEIANGNWADRTGQGWNDLTLDPLFISGWPQANLNLSPESPAIDAGDNTFCPAEDYLSNSRPRDGNKDGLAVCDIGAYEWIQ